MKRLMLLVYIVVNLISSTVAAENKENVGLSCAEYDAPGVKTFPDTSQSPDYNNYEYDSNEEQDSTPLKQYVEKVGIKKCPNEKDVCFAAWRRDLNGTNIVEVQGCWPNMAKQVSCQKRECISNKAVSPTHTHHFCCCLSNLCNVNMTEVDADDISHKDINLISSAIPQTHDSSLFSALKSHKLWMIVCLISAPMILSIIYVAFCKKTENPKVEVTSVASANPKYSSDLLNVDNLKLCSMIGQGKYGTVWKGMINEQAVAVKIFPSQYKQFFLNERDIYCLPLMESPYLLEYYGCDERRTLDDNIEYLLVLSLAPFGCLQEWLIENTTSFNVFVNMAKSIARGLSHLHTELSMLDLNKPCVCHRDLNSRNILVKADLTCCVSDFGFSLKTFGSRYEWKGEITLAERKSINEVGTVRYLAPELLEGVVNLRDCETALKQVDIYSLGLVLWELCVRCHDWYPQGQSIPSYKLPYESDVGKMPSFEQMQILVSRQKVRPQFPPGWGGDAAAKIASDTCEDCWDHDSEARLTALCVEERIREISTVRPHSIVFSPISHRSMIPTHNDNIEIITEHINCLDTISSESTQNSTDGRKINVTEQNGAVLNGRANGHQKVKLFTNNKYLGDRTWNGVRSIINKKMNSHQCSIEEKSILVDDNNFTAQNRESKPPSSLSQSQSQSNQDVYDTGRIAIKAKHLPQIRPNNLDLTLPHTNIPHTHRNLLVSDADNSQSLKNYQSIYKRPPGDLSTQQFAVLDESKCKINRNRLKPCIVLSKSANAVKSLQNAENSDELLLKRQRSLEVFRDVFGVKGSVERLRDPSERIKTPGDVPKSVRKVRASKTLSLYDDRMMNASAGFAANTL